MIRPAPLAICNPTRTHLIGLAACLLLPVAAMAGFTSAFTSPPYSLNATIVGIEDWEMVNPPEYPVHNDPAMAILVDSPVFDAAQPTTLSLKTLVKNMRVTPEEIGDRFVIETRLSVAFNPNYDRRGGLSFRLGASAPSSPFAFGFDHENDGGFFYQGTGDRVVILPRGDIRENVPYTFVVHVDMGAGTFSILLTCSADATFRHEVKDIAFQDTYLPTPANARGLFMGNYRPAFMEAFVDFIKISAE